MVKPNITWPWFEVYNDDQQSAFEEMCRRLFEAEFLRGQKLPHTDHNTPGVEVLPILEPECEDGKPQKRISFQAKYVRQPSYAYSEFKESAKKTVQYFKNDLDLVYLFCNKTLTTTANGYKAIVKIYEDAGIDVEPISNVDILDLVFKYPDIAAYYFQPRIPASMPIASSVVLQGVCLDTVTGNLIISSDVFSQKSTNDAILKDLVAEKLNSCKNYVLALELDALKKELDRLFSYDIDTVEGAGTLYYYRLLTRLHDGENVSEEFSKCADEYKQEAQWLIDFYAAPIALSAEEYQKHTAITQVFAIDRLFTPEHWSDIIKLFETVRDTVDSAILNQIELYYGLSLLNLQQNTQASEVLHALFDRGKEQRVKIYAVFADIRIENSLYQSGKVGHPQVLASLLEQLDSYKESNQYKEHELLIAAIKLESSYHLGLEDKSYLERVTEEYDCYSEEVQKNVIVQFYYGLCLELNGEKDRAIEVYSELNWRTDAAVAERYMLSLILNDEPDTAIAVYDKLEQKTVRTEAIYLFALERSDSESYIDILKESLEIHRGSLAAVLEIAYYTDSEKPAKEVVIPVLRDLMTEESLLELLFYQKIEIILLLAHFREIELMEMVLNSIEDVSTVNNTVVGEVYKALFDVADREYTRKEKLFDKPSDFKATERIADKFLASNTSRKHFLQIKVLCSGAREMPFSFLEYSKELFEITHDEETACNIVAGLLEHKSTNFTEYESYVEVLKKSENPTHCMAVASAMLMLGRDDTAEYYAYKALYLLNGVDDYNVYKSYFSFCHYKLHRMGGDGQLHSVKGNVVVTLEESNAKGDPDRFEICLDSEAEFSDETNRSLDVEHLTSSNSDYIRLRGGGLGQVLRLRGKNYQIVQIISREQYALGYIFRKIQEKPEMFKGVVWMISAENAEEMLRQVKELTDNSEQINSLLGAYHFEKSDAGLPIDAIAFGDYSRYISAFKYLLYQQDEALYTGWPIYENEENQKYVLGLATLVLLSILDRMDVLEAIKSDIIIPESYITFFREEYSKAANMNQVSSSTMYFVEDKPVIQEPDKTIPQIWETILEFCEECERKIVTDQERVDFKIVDGLSGESFIVGFNLSVIHLDALLLCRREEATLLCDDLFFREIATLMGTRNLNIVSLILHYSNPDYAVPFIKELSKTNYIYVPFLARNDEEFKEILLNLLDGEKKKAFYLELISRGMIGC